MHELAPFAERTEAILVESFARSGHVVLWQMGLLDKFMLAVSIRTPVSPSAESFHFPVLAHFSLLFLLVLSSTLEIIVL